MRDKVAEIDAAWSAHEMSWVRNPHLTPSLRNRLAEAQNWRCCYRGCRLDDGTKESMPTFEYIIPLRLGGAPCEENLAIACHACNTSRGHRMTEIHIETLRCLSIADRRLMLKATRIADGVDHAAFSTAG